MANIEKLTLKELFQHSFTELIHYNRKIGMTNHDEVKNYIVNRCSKELGLENKNFYFFKKMLLNEEKTETWEDEQLNCKSTGEWQKLKETNLFKTLMQ